jgi:hypothetical protein
VGIVYVCLPVLRDLCLLGHCIMFHLVADMEKDIVCDTYVGEKKKMHVYQSVIIHVSYRKFGLP